MTLDTVEKIRDELNHIAGGASDTMLDKSLSANDQRSAAVVFGIVNQLLGMIPAASGMSAFGQDPKGLEAKPASPTRSKAKGDAQ
jgi:hypothetical protein